MGLGLTQTPAWTARIDDLIAFDDDAFAAQALPPQQTPDGQPFDLWATINEHRTVVYVLAGTLLLLALTKR